MKKYLGKLMSEVLSYRNVKTAARIVGRVLDGLGFMEFDIFNKIPEGEYVIAHSHRFEVFGKRVNFYALAASAKNKVRGLYVPHLADNPFSKAILEGWDAIPANLKGLKDIKDKIKKNESVLIAIDGPEDKPNANGYLGAAWIAQQTGLSILPIKVTSRRRYVSLKAGNPIPVPVDADKKTLREIIDRVIKEIS